MSRSSAKLLVGVLALLVVIGAVWRLYRSPERLARGAAVERRIIALRVLAESLAARKPGGSVLVVSNPFAQKSGQPDAVYTFEAAALRGLKQGFRGKLTLAGVAQPALSSAAAADPSSVPMPPDTTTPLSFLTAPGAWDAIRREHPGADVWVSLIGLPLNVSALQVWREPQPQFALLLPDLRLVGDANAVKQAFHSGKLIAAVLNRPGPPLGPAASAGDHRAAFDRQFLLVTETNIDAVLQAWPGML